MAATAPLYCRPESSEDSTAPPVPSGYWEATQGQDTDQEQRCVYALQPRHLLSLGVGAEPLGQGEAPGRTISAPWQPTVALDLFGRVCCHQVS